ncbi:MAG: SDR family oxidoreductase [Candidatus Omnitrophica bacterium]|nr:SDR family oxidoreductase [Candidatus Omnitrophota bacterium]
MSLYLITGGAGFIGSHIAEELIRQKEKVRIVDNFVTGKKENLSGVLDEIELIEGDIRDQALMREVTAGVDYVLHQAALRSVPRSVEDPVSSNDVNVNGTLNLLVASRDNKVKRLVYASSSSVYGNAEILPKSEGQKPEPVSPYAVSKLAGEDYCRVFSLIYGLETVSLRYFNVFGPKQDPASQYAVAIPKFIFAYLKNQPPEVHGDGLQSRDFTYIQNVVKANLLAVTAKNVSGRVFNVACGEKWTLMDILSELNRIFGKEISPKFTKSRQGDVRHTLADLKQAETFLGYHPEIFFKEGLIKTVKWFREVCLPA